MRTIRMTDGANITLVNFDIDTPKSTNSKKNDTMTTGSQSPQRTVSSDNRVLSRPMRVSGGMKPS